MADPYQTLGVARGAVEADIKKAYRKLAKELHPDRNKDNPKAAERFSQVTNAYDLLSDKDKRARFDRGEIDGDGNPASPFGSAGPRPGGPGGGFRSQGFEFGGGPGGDGADMSDIFEGLFGGGRGGAAPGGGFSSGFGRRPAAKGANIGYRLAVPFTDAATLSPQRVALPDGALDLKLPPGVETGTQMRLAGKGEQGPGGAGDAIVTIEVQPHRFFTRDGDDIRLDLPISLAEAVTGGQIKAPTVDKPVMLTIPKGTSSGRTLRLKGKGFHKKGGEPNGSRGDQLVTLIVQVPAGDAALEQFVAGWTDPGGKPSRGHGRLAGIVSTSEIAIALTPEDRAKQHGRFRQELTRLKPSERVLEVLKRAGLGVFNDGFIHAGNLAYLALLTLFPFFITAAAVLSVFGQSASAQQAVVSFLHTLPPDTAELLRKPIVDVITAKTGFLLWIAGIVSLWTVSSFVETIRDIFRRAYGTKASAPFWRARLASSGAIIGSVILAMVSFLVQGLLTGAEQFVYHLVPWAQNATGWLGLSRLIPGTILFGALYLMFYLCTPSKYRRTSSRKWPGALFTASWWVAITALLPAVLSLLGGYGATYGSLAGIVVLLTFFWLVGLGFVFGAHLNAALAEPRQAALEGGDAAQAADDAAAGAHA